MHAIVTEVVPRTAEHADAATDEGREWIRARYARADAAYVRLNMITSLTGSATGADGTSDSLTGRIDRAILGAIRRDADVVVVGAQSVRAEGYIVPRTARLAIVTTTGDLAGHRLDADDAAERVMLLTPAERAADVAERTRSLGVPVLGFDGGPHGIVATLAERGLRRVVCEGGPSLASQFAGADAIDEYCVTVAPAIEPVSSPFIAVDAASRPHTDVSGMLVDEAGFSYLRLRRRR